MKLNNPQLMAKVGVPTPQTVIYKSESHKLHQAFVFKAGDTIIQGQPVMLNTDGTISPYLGAAKTVYLGIAVTNSQFPAYPGDEVTVMVSAFAVVYGVATAKVDCGYVTPSAPAEDSQYVGYTNTAEGAASEFIAITPAAAKDDLLQVLIK